MTEHARFEAGAWHEFGKNLIRNKGSDEQSEFLLACRSGKHAFLEHIDKHSLSEKGSKTDVGIVVLEHKFTWKEFQLIPPDVQQAIWYTFRNVPKEMLYSNGFWGYTTIEMIRADYIEPYYLASGSNGTNRNGKYVIDDALRDGDEKEERNKKVDDCVRRILRSMCNPAPRGKRIVFNDFSLGKSYWRWHWADKMSKHLDLGFEEILKIFGEKYYSIFAEKMHTSKSYIGSENTLGGLLLFLAQQKRKKRKEWISAHHLGKLIDRISYLSAWNAIEMRKPNANQREIQKLAKRVTAD